MNVGGMRRAIRMKHGHELSMFLEWLLSPDGHTNEESLADPSKRTMPYVRARSLTDRFVDVTIAADVVDSAWYFKDPDLQGSCVTVSFAGHHRQFGTRVSLPSGECDAWASEIVGHEWASYLYRAGTLSGVKGADRLSTVYYRLFRDETGAPVMKPESIHHEQLRHISQL